MKPTLTSALEQLTFSVKSNDDDSILMIDTALETISQSTDPKCVVFLLLSLDDEFQFDEGMFSVIHTAETFDDKIYISGFLTAIPHIFVTAPRWASIVFMRILNNEETKGELIKSLNSSNSTIKRSVEKLCDMINRQSTDFSSKTVAVLVATR